MIILTARRLTVPPTPEPAPDVPVCWVQAVVVDQAGQLVEGATVTARLSAPQLYDGVVVPATATATTDASGQCQLPLWPNALGADTTSFYTVSIARPGEVTESLRIAVPNETTAQLHEITL